MRGEWSEKGETYEAKTKQRAEILLGRDDTCLGDRLPAGEDVVGIGEQRRIVHDNLLTVLCHN
jgi:hypothetical protein